MKIKTIQIITAVAVSATASHAATIVDTFESNSFSGGTGWSNDWTGSNNFVNGGSEIDGTYSGALFGTASITRNFDAITSGTVSAVWSIKGLASSASFNEIGLNILGLKSDTSSNVLTFKFVDSNTGQVILNDGGSDFGQGTFGYTADAIYDFSFSSEIGSNQYSWSVNERGTANTAFGNDYTYSNSATLTNVNGLTFFWGADSGAGNDGLIDSVTVVPEPSAALLGGIGALLLLRRRK